MMGPFRKGALPFMKHRAFWVRFFLVASLLTAALIFWFSTQEGVESQALSDGVTLQAARIVKPDFEQLPPDTRMSFLETVSYVVRKCAHFLEFTLLGFNLTGLYRAWRWEKKPLNALGLALLTGALYAATDELHQLFISQRSAAVLDVLIDSAGALTGALVMTGLLALALRRR